MTVAAPLLSERGFHIAASATGTGTACTFLTFSQESVQPPLKYLLQNVPHAAGGWDENIV